MESILVGLLVVDRAWALFCDFVVVGIFATFHSLGRTTEEAQGLVQAYAFYSTFPFFALIVGYATLVPSGWRRCATVVTVAAVTPMVFTTAGALTQPEMFPVFLQSFLLPMGAFLTLAVAIAIYGSYRLEVLYQEAVEARKLGQYQLNKRLGIGGMGEVYLVEHMLLRRPCAIKIIRPDRADDPRELARFEREVRTTATLTHPNTVQIFDYGQAEDGTFYYAMEYLPGLSLNELVNQHGPLPPERVIHFLRQVCGALNEAHAIGLIHRDIKPSNIIVCERGGMHDMVKLLDFGLVRALSLSSADETLTQEGTVAGTPAYMSPEQAVAGGNLDARSDIYSLGAVAYYLLTGQPPFAKRSQTQMLAAHLYELPQPIAQHRFDVPAELDEAIVKCLAKDPNQRFPDAASLARVLAACPGAELWTPERAAAWWQSRAVASQTDPSSWNRSKARECASD
jgi:serine/threonine-protein kinase